MICPKCSTDNPLAAKFCFNCAYKFEKQETGETKYSKYIPPQLMKKLNESAKLGGMQKERRIVTTLFCDLQGSTSAAEHLDPEDWTEIISGAFDHLIPPVYQYEGILARLMGDAILAFFGAPIAHEDDAERAILASLEIMEGVKTYSEQVKKEWGVEIEARVGINTGLVVVGEIGSDMRVEYTAMGDAINTAARMETTAEPGTIRITSETNKRIAYMFETEKIGPVEVKGKSKPIVAYKVIKRKTKLDSKKGLSGFDLRFIGRENELGTIISTFEDVFQDKGKVIGLWGDAGIGKSRIIREFNNHLKLDNLIDTEDAATNWFETASLPYQITTPYAPFVELFNTYLSIDFEMDNDEKYEVIRDKLLETSLDESFLPFFASLLNIEPPNGEQKIPSHFEPDMIQKRIQQGIFEFFSFHSLSKPTVLVIDDMHWIDLSSLKLLSELLELTKSHKLYIILVSRVEGQSREHMLERIRNDETLEFHEIHLRPFKIDDANLLISSLLEIEDLPDNLREIIIDKSQGIPFYVEEMIRSLIENGDIVKQGDTWSIAGDIEDIEVPPNLTALLLTRLDQLNEESKRLAQTASVIGREFLFSVLSCITEFSLEGPLENLQTKQWIIKDDLHPEKQYFFKHVMSRDVAYDSLLLKKRRELHRKIANCIVHINSKEIGEIGRHLYEARHYDQALPYLLKSAVKAAQTNANEEANAIYKQVLEIIPEDIDFEILKEVYIGLGQTAALTGNLDESTFYYQKLLDKSKELNDQKGIVVGLNQLAANEVLVTKDATKADAFLSEAEEIARSINFIDGIIETSTLRCVLYQGMGELDKAITWELKGTKLSDETENPAGLPLRSNLALSYLLTLQFDDAKSEAEKLLEAAQKTGELYFEANSYAFIFSTLNMLQGNLEKAMENAFKGHEIALKCDAQFPNHFACKKIADISYIKGNYDELFKYLELAETAIREAPNQGFAVATLISKVNYHFMLGLELDNDEEIIKEAFEFFELPFGDYWGGKSWGDYGYYLLSKGNLKEAESYFMKAIYTPTAPLYIFKPYNQFGLIRILFAKDKYSKALDTLKEIEAEITDAQMKFYYPELYLLKAINYLKLDEMNNSLQAIETALKNALSQGRNNILWRISYVGSWICENFGKIDKAKHYQTKADEVFDMVESNIQSDELRDAFVNKYRSIIDKKEIFNII